MRSVEFIAPKLMALARSALQRARNPDCGIAQLQLRFSGTSSEVLSAVVLAAAGLEGFLNELGEIGLAADDGVSDALRQYGATWNEAERANANTLLKLQLAFMAFAGQPQRQDHPLLDDACVLTFLRGRIIHPKLMLKDSAGEWIGQGGREWKNAIKRLGSKVTLGDPAPGWGGVGAELLSVSIAEWACSIPLQVVESLARNCQEEVWLGAYKDMMSSVL